MVPDGFSETSDLSRRSGRVLVSVVLSFRNEAENIPTLITRLDKVLSSEHVAYELVFVNDASSDQSLPILMAERERNPRIKVVNMSRRFGVAECVMAGLSFTSGDAVVYMDADLQDPPETIPALLARWRAGADVVHTVRTHRHGENALKMLATRIGYRLIRLTSSIELAVDAGDFKLLSREAVDHLLRVPEADPYMRGLVSWLGFNQVFVPYERDARHAGRTHFPFLSRGPWKAFLVGLTSFSFAPVYGVAFLAFAGLAIALGLGAAAAVLMIRDSAYTQTTALLGLLMLLWASTLGAVAVIGLYVIRIYKDVRRRPQDIVRSTVGIPAAQLQGREAVSSVARTPELP